MSERPDDDVGRYRSAARWLAAGAVVPIVAVAAITQADPDLWGHLRFGLDLIATRRIPSVDPYSFTQDRPWVNHEWLSELAMGLAYRAGGVTGLMLLKAALVLTAFALLWRALAGVEFPVRLAVIAAVVIGTGPITKTLRPQLWSLACFAVLCRALARGHKTLVGQGFSLALVATPTASAKATAVRRSFERRRKGRPTVLQRTPSPPSMAPGAWLAAVFVVWANAHGGWLVGAGVIGVWTLVTAVVSRRQIGSWAVVGALSVLATLVTPYGWSLWTFLWQTVGVERDITEWQPLWTEPSIVWIAWIAAAAAGLWSLRSRDALRLPRGAVLALLALMSLRVTRVTPFFVMAAAMFVAPLLPRHERASPTLGGRQDAILALALTAMLAVSGLWIARTFASCISVDESQPWVPDRIAAQALDAARPGRIVTLFAWGEYALWHWGPELRVSMDGRRETVYSDARVLQHDAIRDGRPEGLSSLAEWRAEYVWLPLTSETTRAWLTAHGYRIDVRSARSFVAVREDLPALSVPPAGVTDRRCFPD